MDSKTETNVELHEKESPESRRKRKEKSLQKFQFTIEKAPDAVFWMDKEGRFEYVNDEACRSLGYSREEVQGLYLWDIDPFYSRERLITDWEGYLKGGALSMLKLETWHRRKDGSLFPVEVSAKHGWFGETEFHVAFARDITERKRAEQEMAILADVGRLIGSTLNIDEVYERFAAETKKLIPFDSLAINLYNSQENSKRVAYVSGVDIDGRRRGDTLILEGSLSAAVILARTGLRIQPENIDEIVDRFPRLAPVFQTGLRSLLCVPLVSRDEVIGVLHFRSKKPNAYTEQDLRLAERIGVQIAGAIANAQLFNVLSKMEKSLRESNEVFSLFMRHSPINAFIKEVTPTRSIVLQASDNFLQKIGIPGCEMVGKDMTELFPPEFSAKIAADDRTVVCGGEVLRLDEEFNGRSYTTIKFPILLGEKTLLAGYSIDITDRKRAEVEKRNLEERLQRAKKMEALGQLAGGVAHDLNNFLGVLSGYSELLLREIPAGHRSRRHVEKILQSTEKGAAIIEDLLTLARRGVTALDVVNLNDAVSDFLKAPVFEKIKMYHPQVTFMTDCEENLQKIKGSPVHLEKTLMNLVSNAAESISGKGTVTIRTEGCYLDEPVRGYDEIKEGNYAVLTVSDTGAGISAEDIEKIFEPFYTKKAMGRSGTGLGLAIVWGTVKDHHGYIDVRTEVGAGTTFTLYFPVTREEPIAPQQKESLEQYLGRGESVLVVDDIAEQRDVAAGLLTLLGYKVHMVSSGEAAVEYLKGSKADILVLDMIMAPGIDGLETYRRVLEINPKQKAILVSGFSETERVKEAQKLGAGAYVKKPYLMEKIGLAIRDELMK